MEQAKRIREEIRMRVWKTLEEQNVAEFPRPVYGRIPNFKGADIAANRLVEEILSKGVEVAFVNPDSPQAPLRKKLLELEVLVYVSSPRIEAGFICLDWKKIPKNKLWSASTIKGSFKYGSYVHPSKMRFINLFVAGSVATNKKGARIGKGEGFSELEYGILSHYSLVDDSTVIATTVHDLQVVEDEIPLMPWDFNVDFISTPTKIFKRSGEAIRPKGIFCEYLDAEKIRKIKLLSEICKNENSYIIS